MNRTFSSDNNSGIHPAILKAITEANNGHAKAYGEDELTKKAEKKLQALFRKPVEVYFTFGGTAANVLGLKALTQPHQAILCAESAHIQTSECGAPERFTGCKLLPIPAPGGKLTIERVSQHMQGIGDAHHVQPKVISITQATEYGTLYQPDEIKALADYAHSKNMFLHVDGARISNAVASLNISLQEVIGETGVDVLSFGGTKNGLMCGEAVVFLNPILAKDFKYTRMQGMQLSSKMRFISAQFDALLSNDLWLKNAQNANAMAKLLASRVEKFVKITQKVEANSVFAILPREWIPKLQEKIFFYVWNEKTLEVRWVTSFDTTEEDIESFASEIKRLSS